jgi:hypothetical protein
LECERLKANTKENIGEDIVKFMSISVLVDGGYYLKELGDIYSFIFKTKVKREEKMDVRVP